MIILFKDRLGIMESKTVTYIKEHFNHLEVNEPISITQNGSPKFVLQSRQDYEEQQETIALLKLILISEKSGAKGLISFDEAFDD